MVVFTAHLLSIVRDVIRFRWLGDMVVFTAQLLSIVRDVILFRWLGDMVVFTAQLLSIVRDVILFRCLGDMVVYVIGCDVKLMLVHYKRYCSAIVTLRCWPLIFIALLVACLSPRRLVSSWILALLLLLRLVRVCCVCFAVWLCGWLFLLFE